MAKTRKPTYETDRIYNSKEEVIAQADSKLGVTFEKLDKTGRILRVKNKGKIGQIVEEAVFEININSRPLPDIENLGIELKTTAFKRNKNGTISAKERLVLTLINYMEENFEDFYHTHLWQKCAKMLFLFYDGTLDERKPKDYFLEKNYFFDWIDEDMPTILDDYNRISAKVLDGKAETISESDGNYLSTATKGEGHGKNMREQPYSAELARQRAWELKPSYMTYLLRTYVFNENETESIIKNAGQVRASFQDVIISEVAPYVGKTKAELCTEFGITAGAKQLCNQIIRHILHLRDDVDKSAEFQKANMNLRVIQVNYNGMPKEDSPFRTYSFIEMANETWNDSDVKTEICDKRFMFVFFKATDKTNNDYALEKVVFWGFPDTLIPEAKRVWKETKDIINDGVKLTQKDGKVYTNFPTSEKNKVIFTKIHAQNSYYEIAKDTFVGSGKLSDTDELPDGRRITKHSFWLPKRFIKQIYDEKI